MLIFFFKKCQVERPPHRTSADFETFKLFINVVRNELGTHADIATVDETGVSTAIKVR